MKPLEAVVADMLDGRENDEQITVEVSLLWSLVQRIARLRRIEEAARAVAETAVPDDDFDGQYIEWLVPDGILAILRATLEVRQ